MNNLFRISPDRLVTRIVLVFLVIVLFMLSGICWYWQNVVIEQIRFQEQSKLELLEPLYAANVAAAMEIAEPEKRTFQLDVLISQIMTARDPTTGNNLFDGVVLEELNGKKLIDHVPATQHNDFTAESVITSEKSLLPIGLFRLYYSGVFAEQLQKEGQHKLWQWLGSMVAILFLVWTLLFLLLRPLGNLATALRRPGISRQKLPALQKFASAEIRWVYEAIADLLAELQQERDGLEERVAQRTSELHRAMELTSVASQAKSDFLATMSHEIRTPMNVVLGISDVLLESALDADQRHLVQTMHQSGRALMRVINDVLDFSRIESGRLTLSDLPFSPGQVVEETTHLMQMEAEGKGLHLWWEVASGLPAAVLGDDGRVRQVLINLIGNAIKFTHYGQVSVRLTWHSQESGILLFSVTDTGIGIAPDNVQHIFKHFTQADSGINRRYGGTGLGLAISQKLVELMGGRIGVESQLGQGSTFFFTLPARPVPVAAASVVPVAQTMEKSTRILRILIAEDSPDTQMLLQAYLHKTPHYLVIVNDGLEAVARVRAETFDLLLTDIQMPNMDGYAATRAIRQWEQAEGRAPLIIMALSAHVSLDKREESIIAGCNGHLAKPIRKKTLLDAIQRVAESLEQQDGVVANGFSLP
ncbi:MAG: response regulator [Magnetococcales bacterium]|nr:response regulator [Magnetococcales bacterium]